MPLCSAMTSARLFALVSFEFAFARVQQTDHLSPNKQVN